jgi:hypothetical protein
MTAEEAIEVVSRVEAEMPYDMEPGDYWYKIILNDFKPAGVARSEIDAYRKYSKEIIEEYLSGKGEPRVFTP